MPQPHDIATASQQTATLPATRKVALGPELSVTIRRLTWLEFEALFANFALLLEALPRLNGAAGTEDETHLAQALAGAPALTLQLASLASGIAEGELARWPWDDVLQVATAALRLNFIESAGLRDFSSAVSRLNPPVTGGDG